MLQFYYLLTINATKCYTDATTFAPDATTHKALTFNTLRPMLQNAHIATRIFIAR